MTTVTLTEATRDFYKLMDRVLKGDTVLVTFGRWKKPYAKLIAIDPADRPALAQEIAMSAGAAVNPIA